MQSKRSGHKSEATIQSEIMLALSEAGCVVWRVETAGAWVGLVAHKEAASVTLVKARMIQAGLCKGGADIIGIAPDGRFIGIEVKASRGRATQEQLNFIAQVRNAGGIAGIARSPAEALSLLT